MALTLDDFKEPFYFIAENSAPTVKAGVSDVYKFDPIQTRHIKDLKGFVYLQINKTTLLYVGTIYLHTNNQQIKYSTQVIGEDIEVIKDLNSLTKI